MKSYFRLRQPRKAVLSVGQPYMRPTREPTAELRPEQTQGQSGNPGIYDEILAGWPKVSDHISSLRNALAGAKLWYEPLEDESFMEADWRVTITDMLRGAATDRDNDLVGLSYVAESWLTYWTMGVYVSNIHLYADAAAPKRRYRDLDGLGVELYPIHPGTILSWNQTSDYRFVESVTQTSTIGSATIKRDSLLWVQRGGTVGEYAGQSILRPLVFPFTRWKNIWLSNEQQAFAQGGLLAVTMPKGAPYGGELWLRQREQLEGWNNQLMRFLQMTDGQTAEFMAPSASSNLDQIDKLDAYADLIGSQVSALIDSTSGHRALGEVAAASDAAKRRDDMGVFLERFGLQFSRWLAERAGYQGRHPVLRVEPTDLQASPTEEVTAIAAAKSAGMITWTPMDEAHVRMKLSLDPLPDDGVTPPTTDDVPLAPGEEQAEMSDDPAAATTPTGPDLFYPPAAAVDAVADALIVRRSTPAESRGLSHKADFDLAKAIADGAPLTRLQCNLLRAWFRQAQHVYQQPDFALRGASWQDYYGRGGDAMAQWLPTVLDQQTQAAPSQVTLQ